MAKTGELGHIVTHPVLGNLVLNIITTRAYESPGIEVLSPDAIRHSSSRTSPPAAEKQLLFPRYKGSFKPGCPKTTTMSPPVKPVNCIVDASALLASVPDNAIASIKPWLSKNAINVFVPLQALTYLNELRDSDSPDSLDAEQAIDWLDTITSETTGKNAGRVQLQEPQHEYGTWQEVQRHLLPSPTLSFNDAPDEPVDAVTHMLNNNLALDNGEGPQSGASKQYASSDSSCSASSNEYVAPVKLLSANGRTVPLRYKPDSTELKPLINFVVWRSNHRDPGAHNTGPYILVTNDKEVLEQARKFGARAKLLTQLPLIVDHSHVEPEPNLEEEQENGQEESSDEEKIVYDPSQRPGSSRSVPKRNSNVIDPDSFGRNPDMKPAAPVPQPSRGMDDIARQAAVSGAMSTTPLQAYGSANGNRGSAKGRRSGYGPNNPRANGHSPRGRGHQVGTSSATPNPNSPSAPARGAYQNGNMNGIPGRGRANPRHGLGHTLSPRSATRGGRGGRGGAIPTGPNGQPHTSSTQNGPYIQRIDPDSYVRTPPGLGGRGGRGGRGRGGTNVNGRKLWVPEG
ncbi:MAG: hypothetical protein M1831_005503 [Alyxoria varia]|nr:MAG: hypothetical protein M1831_005503 [Alyxoria varia]